MAAGIAEGSDSAKLLVLFGSQTGTAQDVAVRIARQGENRGFAVQLSSMDGFLPKLAQLSKAAFVVFVASTTGDGTPPDNMREFWHVMTRADLPATGLSSVQAAVLGLGDSSYSKFNVTARKLSVRLAQVGARELCPRGLADEQSPAGLEGDVDAWLRDSLWPAAVSTFLSPTKQAALRAAAAVPGGLDSPRCIATRFRVRREFGTAPPDGDPALFGAFLAELSPAVPYGGAAASGFPGQAPAAAKALTAPPGAGVSSGTRIGGHSRHEGGEAPRCIEGSRGAIEAVVSSNLRISADSWSQDTRAIRLNLSFFATDAEEAEKLAELGGPGGGQLYCDFVEREARSWAEVLFDFPSVAVPLAHLLELVGPLRPREFSVSSSPLRHPGVVELCVAVVDFRTPLGRRKRGVCSNWMASLPVGARLAVWLRPGTLPPLCTADAAGRVTSPPAILVGPGTGVAPIRALLQERAELLVTAGERGSAAAVVATPGGFTRAGGDAGAAASAAEAFPRLYFGCRSAASDFYFQSDWWRMVAAGELGALRTAFSRDGGPDAGPDGKVYVQARIAQDADAVAHVLTHPQGRVVICGSAKRMPSDVADVFVAVLQSRKSMTAVDARRALGTMQAAGRYQVEAWS